ncbi:uncharacterized protein LOC126371977 [Pectinophora gossypiella]|uniref:uncharacterized protein LOC126371977 n=1 Tax=Pectinophora gossypiella TaxID=13191 RepID=UPI00214EADE4|nr:uncharacterized protein LOC126371977 [Pectinophora gossypiella]
MYIGYAKGPTERPEVNLSYRNVKYSLEESLMEDQGPGCDVPKLDPFAPEGMKFHRTLSPIKCSERDWVTCYLSECRPTEETVRSITDLECIYYDIIYINDENWDYGNATVVSGDSIYYLVESDHVKITCTGIYTSRISRILFGKVSWSGYGCGFRRKVNHESPPSGMEDNYDVLIIAFDSTSKNGFIRKMPVSYKYITKELQATVLNKYNIVGDATVAALFPILTGKTDSELPESRKDVDGSVYLDHEDFIFYRMKKNGYRTAYFEDMPWVGTFQLYHNGFLHQPADHYLRDIYKYEEGFKNSKWWPNWKCFGEQPRFQFMINLTEQFYKLEGKHFSLTFIADVTHGDFNHIDNADRPLAEFLKSMYDKGTFQNTLLIVMGDHGPRFANIRDTYQGFIEERLPFMAIRLPDNLRRIRLDAQTALENNAEVLTTPHDIHATILDVVNLTPYWNFYKVKGADVLRALTLLQPLPSNRSCSVAGIEDHWCTCLHWEEVKPEEPLYMPVAQALVDYINKLTESERQHCALRTLRSVQWVVKHKAHVEILRNLGSVYQVKITVGPGKGVYEAAMTYMSQKGEFFISSAQISRVNAYKDEPKCITETHPQLNKYCYCMSSNY